MAEKDINGVDALNPMAVDANDRILVSDNSASNNGALKRATPDAVSKYAVETYNGTSLGGSNKTVQAAINDLNSNINNPTITTINDLNTYLSNASSAARSLLFLNATVTNTLVERNASSIAIVAKMDNTTADMSLYSLGGNYIGIIRYNFSTSTVTKKIEAAQKSDVEALNSNFVITNSVDDLCAKVAALPFNANATIYTDTNATKFLTQNAFSYSAKGFVARVSSTLADAYVVAYPDTCFSVRFNFSEKTIVSCTSKLTPQFIQNITLSNTGAGDTGISSADYYITQPVVTNKAEVYCQTFIYGGHWYIKVRDRNDDSVATGSVNIRLLKIPV